jgi:2-hydroxy-3-keto-5-methylthiopentenyl-1-phosphate phosphatase
MVSKVQVMAQHPAEEQIAIGDSVTDLNMALYAPVVFARDRLIHYLDEHGKPYIQWNDFFDVREQLCQRWQDT